MYFQNRAEAGAQLAEVLFHPYGHSQSVILALGAGGLLVAGPIAERLDLPVYMIATKEINLPGNFHERVGTVDQAGDFVFNSELTQGQVDEYVGEYHNHIDTEKMNAMHGINAMMGQEGFVEKEYLLQKTILLVSDGFKTAVDLDAVLAYLKPVEITRLVGITPIASIDAIDKLHLLTDEIRILSPKENYIETDHYYEENELPDDEGIQKIISELSSDLSFKQGTSADSMSL